MQLLFDEQLSEDLCTLLSDICPGSLHVRTLGAGGASDLEVFHLARDNDAVLVTKDQDFHRLAVMHGAPPRVIWVRLGNCTTAEVADLLRRHLPVIEMMLGDADATFLEVG